MQYVIMVYESKEDLEKRDHPEKKRVHDLAYAAYSQALVDAGLMRGGEGLEKPQTATVVSVRNGKRLVQDGPYADTKEQLGGFFVIEAPNLDVALEWAARCPATATGKVEVRPTMTPPDA